MVFRILSLDGGGIWSLIQVKALIALYDSRTTGHQVLQDFDLVAANSGGSIVLGGLAENLQLGDVLAYFRDETKRKAMFSPTSSVGDRVLEGIAGIGPKYSAAAKLPALERLMPISGDKPLSSVVSGIRRTGSGSDVHLLIVGFDYDRCRAKFFRSAQASAAGLGEGAADTVTLAEAIHASSNAPVNYFDDPAEFPGQTRRYWDGGMTGCNNPVLAAAVEAVALGQSPASIVALSLGTGTVMLPLREEGQPRSPFLQDRSGGGVVADLGKLATAILDDPPDMATFVVHVMTGGAAGLPAQASSRVVRMSPLVTPITVAGAWSAPSGMTKAQFGYLAGLDMDAIEQPQVDAIAAFADLWIGNRVRNQPIRMDGDTLALELGDAWFTDAVVSWRAIK